ncbi:MAG: ComEC/Rec2 family competence protein [Candidatus Pacebacteria bacterium]|nr:ComEC/Rec2 family competence protein [Candidatus Paceibacterota bacterium]
MTLSPSRVFRQCGASFLIALILSRYLPFSFFLSLIIYSVIYILFSGRQLSSSRKQRFLILFLVLLSFSLGQYRYFSFVDKLNKSAIKEAKQVEMEASIISEPVLKTNYQKILVPNIVIYTERFPVYQYGDKLKIKGKLEPLKEFYSYNSIIVSGRMSYPKIELVSSSDSKFSFQKTALSFKNKITHLLQRIIPEPQASLLNSILLGGKHNLTASLEEEIRKSGLSHIIVVSGLHLSIITQMLSNLLGVFCLGNLLNFIISCLFLLGFSLMVGFNSSIIRAAIMAFLLVLSRLNFRLYNPLNALFLAALVMVWFNPLVLFLDLGFQLSFLATTGILLFYPLWNQSHFWQQSFFNNRGAKIIKETTLSCFSAMVLVVPWVMFKTQSISLVAPLTNILVVPLVSLIIAGGFITALFAFIIYPLGLFFGFWLNLIMTYLLKIISYCAKLPFAELYIPYSLRWLIVPYYIFLFLYLRKKNS